MIDQSENRAVSFQMRHRIVLDSLDKKTALVAYMRDCSVDNMKTLVSVFGKEEAFRMIFCDAEDNRRTDPIMYQHILNCFKRVSREEQEDKNECRELQKQVDNCIYPQIELAYLGYDRAFGGNLAFEIEDCEAE